MLLWMPQRHVIDRTHTHALFDKTIAPVLTVDSGDEITFETLDACWGLVRSIEDFERYRAEKNRVSNPITGPVRVRGAKVGGVIAVDVIRIELDATGFQLIGPNRGVVRDEAPIWECQVVHVEGDRIRLDNGITLPALSMIGQLANAPAGEPRNTPGYTGGNLDCPQIAPGARVYLPIEVDGAIFSLGDVHARQGDGELAGAAEIGACVTVRLTAIDVAPNPWPLIEHGDTLSFVASADAEGEAIRLASIDAARYLARVYEVRFVDAMMLLTLIAEIRCTRTQRWGAHGPVVTVSFSKSLAERSFVKQV